MSTTPSISPSIFPALIKGASPVLFDLAAYTLAHRFFSAKTSYAAASLAGAVSLVAFCSSTEKQTVRSGLTYLAYKVVLLALNYRSSRAIKPSVPPANPHPEAAEQPVTPPATPIKPASQDEAALSAPKKSPSLSLTLTPRPMNEREKSAAAITEQFDALKVQVTKTFDGTLNITAASDSNQIAAELRKQEGFQKEALQTQMRLQWSSLTQKCDKLMTEADREMTNLLKDAKLTTKDINDPEERKKAIANCLIKDFDPSNNKTLIYIYRFIRGKRYIIHCPHVEHPGFKDQKNMFFTLPLTEDDLAPFSKEGTDQYSWRQLYNKAIEAYIPFIPYMPAALQKWFVPDDGTNNFTIVPK